MKRFTLAICACLLASLLAGCAQVPAEDKFLSHWEKIVSMLSDNRNDAAKATAAVKDYLKNNLEEMKTLAGQFGKETEKKIAEDPNFIRRVIDVLDKINALQKDNPGLFNSAGLNEAMKPLSDLMK